jgi:hypothetical protein
MLGSLLAGTKESQEKLIFLKGAQIYVLSWNGFCKRKWKQAQKTVIFQDVEDDVKN